MSEAVVAKRYAEALFQLVDEKNIADKIGAELQVVKEVFVKDENLSDLLSHPRISAAQKNQLIDTAFGTFDKSVVNTLKLLVKRGRVENVIAVIDDYTALFNDKNGIGVATVYSVRPLTESEKINLATTLKIEFNKQTIEIDNKIDASLIGGVKIRVGNTIYDGSISNKLNRFRTNLLSASK